MINRIWLVVFAIVLVVTAMPLQALADGPAPVLNLLRDSTPTNSGLNFLKGTFGTSINGQTFQNEAVVTFNGWQYTTYWKDIRTGTISGAPRVANTRLAISRRQLPDGQWQEVLIDNYWPDNYHFEGYNGTQDNGNVHNVAAIGISSDGVIHLSFDHHVSGLRYIKSVPNAATNPSSVTWNREVFGNRTAELIAGSTISDVAYPLLIPKPDGGLNFIFRQGSSGAGDWQMYEYTSGLGANPGAWTYVGKLFSGGGTYTVGSYTSPSRCAYPNSFRYGNDGKIHATWVWRELNGNSQRTNHDLCYAYSEDEGITWKNNGGTVIAKLDGTLPGKESISLDTEGIVAFPIDFGWGLQNQGTMYIDSDNRPHTVLWRNPRDGEGAEENDGGTYTAAIDMNKWRYYHYWRDEVGTWHEERLPFWGRKPQTMLDNAGNMYVLFGQSYNLNYQNSDPGIILSVAMGTENSDGTGWGNWKVTHIFPNKMFHGEPLYDIGRWKNDGVLSIYSQERPEVAGMPSNLHVIDLKYDSLRPNPTGDVVEVTPGSGDVPDPWANIRNLTQAVKNNEGDVLIPAATVVGFSAQQTGSGDSNNPATKLIDGDLGDASLATGTNRWAAEGYNPPDGQWVIIDLGANKKIRQTKMHPVSGRKYQYHIEVWKSGQTSTNAVRIVNRTSAYNDARPVTDTFDPYHEARYVKFTVTAQPHDTTAAWVAIRELEIFGVDMDNRTIEINTLKAVNQENHIILAVNTDVVIDAEYVIHAIICDESGSTLKHVKVPILDDVSLNRFYVVLDAIPNAKTVKVFIWKSMDDMIPVSNVKTADITT